MKEENRASLVRLAYVVLQAHLVLRDSLEREDNLDFQDRMVDLVHPGQLDLLDLLVKGELLVKEESQDRGESLVLQEVRATRAREVLLEHQDRLVLKAHKDPLDPKGKLDHKEREEIEDKMDVQENLAETVT